MNNKLNSILLVIASLLLIASNTFYTVKQSEYGVKLRFGRVVQANLAAGLGIKIPFVDNIRRFDSRAIALNLTSEEYITQEKKRLIVDSFIIWRIINVEKFYTATGGLLENAESLLRPRINEGLRNKFGERIIDDVVSGARETLTTDLTIDVNKRTTAELGIKVMDIRVKKIELPASVSGAVYSRMRAEREQEANEHRSRGKELAEGIRADADRQVRIIQAEAYRDAEAMRGTGDAQAANIYAKAYNADKNFYAFYRSLLAYRNSFSKPQDVLVVEPRGEFFRYMEKAR